MPISEKTGKQTTALHNNKASTFFSKEGSAFFNNKNSMFFQPKAKLEVSQPGDPQELEADKLADKIMRMEDHSLHHK